MQIILHRELGFVLTVRTCIALMTKKHMGIPKYKETLTNSVLPQLKTDKLLTLDTLKVRLSRVAEAKF